MVSWLIGVACVGALTARPAAASTTTVQPGNIGNQTWTPAGSPYIVLGDITVQTGATLTIEAGTVVQFALTDANSGGLSPTQVELTVMGSLVVSGTWANPVTFEAQTGTAPTSWYGIVVGSTATAATITGAVIAEAQVGVSSSGTAPSVKVSQTLVEDGTNGLSLQDATVSEVRVTAMTNAGIVFSGFGSITNTIIDHCSSVGISIGGASGASLTVENCTIDRNGYGVNAVGASGSSVSVVNTLVTSNNSYGLARNTTTSFSSSYCDVWNNGLNNYSNLAPGIGSISANPAYVSSTDYHLQAGSFAIDSGTSAGAPSIDFDLAPRPQNGDGIVDSDGSEFDMGAYEHPGSAVGTDGGTSTGGAAGGSASGQAGAGGAAGGAGAGGVAGAGGTGAAGSGAAGTSGGGGAAGVSGTAGTSGGGGAAGISGAAGTPGSGGAAGTSGSGGAAGGGGMIAGSAGASGAGIAGVGGAVAGRGGAGGQGATGGSTGGVAGAGGGPSGSGSSGCGCETGGGGPEPLPLALGLLGVTLFARRRRRS